MSKLFKQLIYDTDRVSQPGDPLTSPDGNTKVKANNDGTATLEKTIPAKTIVAEAHGSAGITYGMVFTSKNTAEELAAGIPESVSGTLSLGEPVSSSYTGTWTQIEPGAPVYAQDGVEYRFSFSSEYCDIFGGGTGCSATYTMGTVPASTESKTLTTEDYVNDKIGNINAILDEINGEVI